MCIGMPPSPEEVARRIGKEYIERPVIPDDPEESNLTVKAFTVMRDINAAMFAEIPVDVKFQEEDPYRSYEHMRREVEETDILRVFNGGDPHPLWGNNAEIVGRAVHDWYGHLELDVPFTVEGEYQKWKHARDHYPAYCDRVLFTEVIGQLGAAYYLEDGFGDDRFEQKVFPAPNRWIEDMALAVESKENVV